MLAVKLSLDTRVLRALEPGPETSSELGRMLQTETGPLMAALSRLMHARLVEEVKTTTAGRTRWFYQLTRGGRALPDDAVRRRYRAYATGDATGLSLPEDC